MRLVEYRRIGMSQYIEFFINPGTDNTFHFLDSYSRSNSVYQAAVDYVPYGKITLLQNVIPNIKQRIKEEESQYQQQVKKQEEMIETVSHFSNTTIEDRLNVILEYKQVIDELEEEIKNLRFAYMFYTVLSGFDENIHIYAGIEVGEPTKEDII